ncbi:MAG TPA: class I tRNA ligase family protein, partial [Patescibacteria group bacterium]|nr:class I tRNA ligase family protein [Patescibacteria group bacterium]
HKKAVQKALQHMYDQGDIYLGEYEGLYCQGCEQYKSESDLVDGKCPDHDIEPEKVSEETYLFRMSKYTETLRKKIEDDEIKIRPEEKKNEILAFYKNEGLHDISFSRKKVSWGIPLPWDESHTAYVWADAFLNYLTVLGWPGQAEKAPDFWPPQTQLMSKDILRVHATIWPAMLLSLGLDLPEEIFVHGFFMVDGKKMSKTLGNVITPQDLGRRYGVDGARYLLMQATVFGYDGDISWNKFDERFNAYLANGLGNLVARVLSLTEKNFSGLVPEADIQKAGEIEMLNESEEKTGNFQDNFQKLLKDYQERLQTKSMDGAIEDINALIGSCDKHISAIKLWELVKSDPEAAASHIYALQETIRRVAWLVWPFMPETTENILAKLGLDSGQEMGKKFAEAMEWGGLSAGQTIEKGKPLFPRLQD